MSLTFNEAADDIFQLIKAAWDITGLELSWPNVKPAKPTNNDSHAKVFIRHVTGGQRTIGSSNLFERVGLVTIQVFIPVGKGLQEGYTLAKVLVDAFEGKSTSNGVWFKNTVPEEANNIGQFFQINVVTEFWYHEQK